MFSLVGKLANQFLGVFGLSIRRKPTTSRADGSPVGSTMGARRVGLTSGWDIPEEFIDAFDALEGIASSSWQSYFSIWQSVKYIQEHSIPGAIVECGVELGAGLVTFGNALEHFGGVEREIFGFDTFSGMPDPSGEDFMSNGRLAAELMSRYPMRNGVRDFCLGFEEEVDEALRVRTKHPRNNFSLIPGLVEETIPSLGPEQIALLRLDTDWYESTRHNLENLYPLLSAGGVLIIDDYGAWHGARKAVDEYFEGTRGPLLSIDSPERSRIGVKPYFGNET